MNEWQKFQEGFIGNEIVDYTALGIVLVLVVLSAWLTWKEYQ